MDETNCLTIEQLLEDLVLDEVEAVPFELNRSDIDELLIYALVEVSRRAAARRGAKAGAKAQARAEAQTRAQVDAQAEAKAIALGKAYDDGWWWKERLRKRASDTTRSRERYAKKTGAPVRRYRRGEAAITPEQRKVEEAAAARARYEQKIAEAEGRS